MIDLVIRYSFYLLFFLTPLFWTSLNYELFEYNKMILTYGFTVLITGSWILKMLSEKSFILKRTPLDIPLLLFLLANILSTIFSIDTHTSIWGYYSRSNGGLLSLISYLLLYWAFVSNIELPQIKKLLKIGLLSGFIVSIWAILEHFGASPSCLILKGQLNTDCWIQDVQARVFASLGQPNWLAAYLSMLIFPALYFFLTAPTRLLRTRYYILLTVLYLAFTFTYSRGPTLGFIGGIVTFVSFWLIQNRFWSRHKTPPQNDNIKPFVIILASFLLINILFGSALTSFRLVSKFAAPTRPGISLPQAQSIGTQLENGGTESGQIRYIVWTGALEIFKHYPIFGSGLETFAYSYYQFRPVAHNLTSEWDFLYNKAHNEYLNYLSTTGILGFGTYIFMIGFFVIFSIRLIKNIKPSNETLLAISLLGGYISYLIYNFFLFSVVIIAIFFYLFPALIFVALNQLTPIKKVPTFLQFIYKKTLYIKIAKIVTIILSLIFLFNIFTLWYADTIFNQGQKASDSGNAGMAYNLLSVATDLNKNEPFYRSELAYSAAAAASALQQTDATLSAELKDEALIQLNYTLKNSPRNVSFWRTAVRTYFEISSLDKKYIDSTLQALNTAIKLAPTDPKLYLNKALVLESQGRKDEAIIELQKALQLKLNYVDAIVKIQEATASSKKP